MKIFRLILLFATALAIPAAVHADSTGNYGDVQLVNAGPASDPTVFQLTSSHDGGYAGIYHRFDALLLNQITQLSADYQMTMGTIGAGSPRFTFFDSLDRTAWIYFGNTVDGGTYTDPLIGLFGSTGNFADLSSSQLRVQSNGFGGYNSGYPSITWADFVANAGSSSVAFATIDLDSGYALANGQQMLTDNFSVNGSVLAAADASAVPEPATWAMMLIGFGGVGFSMRRRKPDVARLRAIA